MNEVCENIQSTALQTLLENTLNAKCPNVFCDKFSPVTQYISNLASYLCVSEMFHQFEWNKICKVYLESFISQENAETVTKEFMDECEKRVPKQTTELDIPEGTGEILCNVEFKLAYGGKILLNTTHFHVRRGRIYGLLGHNGCGKSTLMRAISSGQLAGFPGAEELMKLRACFVDHDIDGSDANTPTIDFVFKNQYLRLLVVIRFVKNCWKWNLQKIYSKNQFVIYPVDGK